MQVADILESITGGRATGEKARAESDATTKQLMGTLFLHHDTEVLSTQHDRSRELRQELGINRELSKKGEDVQLVLVVPPGLPNRRTAAIARRLRHDREVTYS